jgi:spectinomycin phosphotransferase
MAPLVLEPPAHLDNATLLDTIRKQYGLPVTALTFLPLGHDPAAWVYRAATADGTAVFIKIRLRMENQPALLVPFALHEQGITHVIAPLATTSGALYTHVAGYALILYPFVAGRTGLDGGMTPEQWRAYGQIMRKVHAAAITPELAATMRRETFAPEWAATLRRVDALLDEPAPDELTAELAAFWREQRPIIHTVLMRAERLGQQLMAAKLPLVLCHADAHVNNVLLDPAGQPWLIDWDETMLAPKERDLMFVRGGGISRNWAGTADEAAFFAGYGPAVENPLALAYYRYVWAVGDIASYGEQVCLRPDFGEVTRRAGLDMLRSQFAPGNIVDIALETEA